MSWRQNAYRTRRDESRACTHVSSSSCHGGYNPDPRSVNDRRDFGQNSDFGLLNRFAAGVHANLETRYRGLLFGTTWGSGSRRRRRRNGAITGTRAENRIFAACRCINGSHFQHKTVKIQLGQRTYFLELLPSRLDVLWLLLPHGRTHATSAPV